jgi:hypothetical protein
MAWSSAGGIPKIGASTFSERRGLGHFHFSALFERETRARSSADRAGGFGPETPRALCFQRGAGSDMRRVFRCLEASDQFPVPGS